MSIKYNGGYIPAVGADGQILVADSSTSTGLRYNPTSAAGKNAIINGGFDIWQRGTSISVAASTNAYTADRWFISTATSQACTVSRQPTSDTTNLPFIQYCARIQRNSGQTGTGVLGFWQGMETVNSIPFAGKVVTASFYARAGANFSASGNNLTVIGTMSGTGTDQNLTSGYTGQVNGGATTATLTTTWQRFTVTATIPTNATELTFYTTYSPTGTAGANDYFEITGVQLELGSTATTFSRAGGSIGGELAACQRYYYRATPLSIYSPYASGWCTGTTTASFFWQFPTTMRQSTSIGFSNVAPLSTTGGGAAAFTALTTSYGTNNGLWLQATGSSSLTTGSGTILTAAGTTSSYIENNAEL